MSKRLEKREIRGMRSTINIGKIEGGINTNVVPNLCRTEIDRRLLPTEDYNNSFDEMLEIIENCTESKKYCTVRKLRGTNGFSGKKDSVIVKNISKSYREIVGHPIKFSNAIGVSDGRYFSDDDIEIVSFGPGIDKEGHSANESIVLSTMTESALVLENAIGYILGYKNI
jgi:acetylornithine deacetylase/succinyl-diaminopimelate desuccinylase-like protein